MADRKAQSGETADQPGEQPLTEETQIRARESRDLQLPARNSKPLFVDMIGFEIEKEK